MNILKLLNDLEEKGKDKDEIILWKSLLPAMTEEEISDLEKSLEKELSLIDGN